MTLKNSDSVCLKWETVAALIKGAWENSNYEM